LAQSPTQASSGSKLLQLVSLEYHETTKHYFGRFARSRGYLDWATQPDPFRRYSGARLIALPHEEGTGGDRGVDRGAAAPLHRDSIAWFLRYSMALSAWKAYRDTRWALRVNPSSGNLHPTEAYLVHDGRIHYVPREHAVEERAVLPDEAWQQFLCRHQAFLVALTSIQWREAWKYGERAFRYCQHDVGHAIAALRVSAALFGWTLRLLPEWSDERLAALLGVDRDQDRGEAEPEQPECLALVAPTVSWTTGDPASLVAAARSASWQGHANVLSSGHDEWPVIERVTRATHYAGQPPTSNASAVALRSDARFGETSPEFVAQNQGATSGGGQLSNSNSPILYSRDVILRRRSALAFDGRSTLSRERFVAMLRKLEPSAAPFDAIDWPPHVHLALFVHRID
jgi:SagB-type dehydrogenase family enzyme